VDTRTSAGCSIRGLWAGLRAPPGECGVIADCILFRWRLKQTDVELQIFESKVLRKVFWACYLDWEKQEICTEFLLWNLLQMAIWKTNRMEIVK
jgi:hypothetical protein